MDNETANEKEIRDRAFVVIERFQKEKETFDRLHALRYRFMVLFGNDKESLFKDLYRIVQEIFISANMLGVDWRSDEYIDASKDVLEQRRKRIQKHEAIFWQIDEDDSISKRLDEIIRQIEKECKAIIQ